MTGADADFLSGHSGIVSGRRARLLGATYDLSAGARALLRGDPRLLDRIAGETPRQRVLALALERRDVPNLLTETRQSFSRTRHAVTWRDASVGNRGKFENLNRLLCEQDLTCFDWLVVVDDDVRLPPRFLDRFIGLSELIGFRLVQPAHRMRSHAAWGVTRRVPAALARETRFVEIGPLTAFHAETFPVLLPFPELRFGWGLDLHWSALAAERGWKRGVIDATPIRHGLRETASLYLQEDAISEARAFLNDRPYVRREEAGETLRHYGRSELRRLSAP